MVPLSLRRSGCPETYSPLFSWCAATPFPAALALLFTTPIATLHSFQLHPKKPTKLLPHSLRLQNSQRLHNAGCCHDLSRCITSPNPNSLFVTASSQETKKRRPNRDSLRSSPSAGTPWQDNESSETSQYYYSLTADQRTHVLPLPPSLPPSLPAAHMPAGPCSSPACIALPQQCKPTSSCTSYAVERTMQGEARREAVRVTSPWHGNMETTTMQRAGSAEQGGSGSAGIAMAFIMAPRAQPGTRGVTSPAPASTCTQLCVLLQSVRPNFACCSFSPFVKSSQKGGTCSLSLTLHSTWSFSVCLVRPASRVSRASTDSRVDF